MSMLDHNAMIFAMNAHNGQVRKYTGEPYITHCAGVVQLVRTVVHTPQMVAAAWLHDTVEDCGVTLATIEEKFGADVAALVEQLTDVSKPSDGNRATRKGGDRS